MSIGKQNQVGQGMTEYIIIVALIAIAAIAAFSYFGQAVRAQTGAIAQEVAGQSGKQSIANAATAANSAVEQGSTKKGLSNYGDGNQTGGAGSASASAPSPAPASGG